MEFSANNQIVRLCLQAMAMEEKGLAEEATKLFSQAWREATHDLERFISAHFLARQQLQASDKLKWLETALQLAVKINDDTVRSAFPHLYASIAKCYQDLNDSAQASKHYALAESIDDTPTDQGPFFHGTKAELKTGDLLKAGEFSNYKRDLKMNHIYFTALINGAGLAAELAKGDKKPRVYLVEPTGSFENDPNVTNQKFPGNPTRSYRSQTPLKVIDEVTDWKKLTSEDLEQWRRKLADNKGEIIN